MFNISDLFPTLILGHMIGDYLFQNKWMAMNKSASSFKCFIHCLIYTISVSVTTYPILHGWLWSGIVFISHYPIDRWSLADKWLDLINGRSLRDFMDNGKKDIPLALDFDNYHILRGGFTAFVYAVTDNTIHIVLLWYAAKFLMVWA